MKFGSCLSASIYLCKRNCSCSSSGILIDLIYFSPFITMYLSYFQWMPNIFLLSFFYPRLMSMPPSSSWSFMNSYNSFWSLGLTSIIIKSNGALRFIAFGLRVFHDKPYMKSLIPFMPVASTSTLHYTTALLDIQLNLSSKISREASFMMYVCSGRIPIILTVCLAFFKSSTTAGRLPNVMYLLS